MQIHENEQGNRKEANKVKYCNGFLKKGGERHEMGSKILVQEMEIFFLIHNKKKLGEKEESI